MAYHAKIESLAEGILEKRELELAERFAELMGESGRAINPLVLDILPVFYEGDHTFEPRAIYRSLMYIRDQAVVGHSRSMIHNMGDHLESLLQGLGGGHISLGRQINSLRKRRIITDDLADRLSTFNEIVYAPAKHVDSIKVILESRVDKRTFTYQDAAYALLIMRRLSIELFKLLKEHGTMLPQDWKDLDYGWASKKHGK